MEHNYLKYRPLKQNDVILILGACLGEFMQEYKQEILDKNIYVINIEPNIELCAKMLLWIKDNLPLNATALNVAVSSKNEITKFRNNNNFLTSHLEKTESQFQNESGYDSKILVMTLDDIIDNYDIDCIFCDIEGSEIKAFKYYEYINIYLAIASYHIVKGEPTYKKLKSNFEKYGARPNIIIDNPDEWSKTMLYLIPEEI